MFRCDALTIRRWADVRAARHEDSIDAAQAFYPIRIGDRQHGDGLTSGGPHEFGESARGYHRGVSRSRCVRSESTQDGDAWAVGNRHVEPFAKSTANI
jgi:hypothetical protein